MTFLDEENVVELLFFFQIKRNTQGLCPHAAVSHELVVGELVFLSSNRFIFLPDFRGRSQSLSLTVHLSKRKKKRNIRPTERNARKFLSPPALDFLPPCDFYTAMARAANLDLDARPPGRRVHRRFARNEARRLATMAISQHTQGAFAAIAPVATLNAPSRRDRCRASERRRRRRRRAGNAAAVGSHRIAGDPQREEGREGRELGKVTPTTTTTP